MVTKATVYEYDAFCGPLFEVLHLDEWKTEI